MSVTTSTAAPAARQSWSPGGPARSGSGRSATAQAPRSRRGVASGVEVLAPVRAEEGVGHTKLEDGELGARLEVEGFPDVKLEGGVVSGDSLAAVHVDSGAHPFLTSGSTRPCRPSTGRCCRSEPTRGRGWPPGSAATTPRPPMWNRPTR